jgi:hypothetical protein
MEKKIREYVDNVFSSYENNSRTVDIKEEVISNLLERVNDLLKEGFKRNEAFDRAIESIGSKEDLIKTFDLKKVSEYRINYLAVLSTTVVSTIVYLVLGFVFDLWNPSWLVFFVGLMVLGTIESKFGVVWLLAMGIYILTGSLYGDWFTGLVIFGIAASLSAGKDKLIAGIWVLIITSYFVLGFGYGLWHPGWLIFFVGFALTVIIVEKSIVAFSWLVAIFAFLFIGFVYSLWNPTWVVFLLAAAITVYLETGRRKVEEETNNE